MAEYIEREALLKKINEEYDLNYGEILTDPSDFADMVDFAPAADVQTVVHGRWEAVHDGWGRCPNCHRMDSIHEKATHCRFCGTKMDGGVSDG